MSAPGAYNGVQENERTVHVLRIHFIYVAAILSAVVILLATFEWTSLKDFTVYLSNAATFTSLALAVVAIVISVVAGSDLSRGLGQVTQANSEIRGAVLQMSDLMTSATEVAERASQSNTSLQTLISSLNAEFEGLRRTADTLATSTTSIEESVAALPTRFDRLEGKIDETIASQKPAVAVQRDDAAIQPQAISTIAKNLATSSSVAGYVLAYAIFLCHKNKKDLSLKQLAELVSTVDYLYGYLVAIDTAGIIDFKPKGNSLYEIRTAPSEFALAKQSVERQAQSSKDASVKEKWMTAIAAVERLYGPA